MGSVIKDYEYNRILDGKLVNPEDLSAETSYIVIGGPPAYDILDAAEVIGEAVYLLGKDGELKKFQFGKIDLIVTDYEGLKKFASSPTVLMFIMIPFTDIDDHLCFVGEFRQIEKAGRPLGGYRKEVPDGIIRWQDEGRQWGEELDFQIGEYSTGYDGGPLFNYSSKIILQWLQKSRVELLNYLSEISRKSR